MPKAPSIETLLRSGSAEWNKLRKAGKVGSDHTGATFAQLYSANADLSALELVGTEWEKCDLSKVSFRDSDLSNAYFHGGRLQDCDFRGANLEGATFEKMKVLRCDFSGARGLEGLELDDVDLDRVVGLDGEEAPPPPPPPAVGVTSFTREQRNAMLAAASGEGELPPFRPQDTPASLLARGFKTVGTVPPWVLDVPGLRPPLPGRLTPGTSLESLLREAVKARLENRRPVPDPGVSERAQKALRLGTKEAHFAALYLREVGEPPKFRFSAAKALKDLLRAELEVEDLTASVDPRITGALWELKLPHEVVDQLGELRRRLAAAQLFTALLEAGFNPENNWEEALEASEPALDLATVATSGDRDQLSEAFAAFAAVPDEVRLRRLAYNAEATAHLEALAGQPAGTEPTWISGPEARECHDVEMVLVAALKAADIPTKAAELAQAELGVPVGSVPEESEDDLFIHVRCPVCGKEKLIVQSP
ncbi:MAG: pentapeptide repeat-containing protein [Myxococcota bacterium]